MESALSVKGQATIPKAVREYLHLGPGDRIKFFLHPDGTVVILPKLPASRLKGMVRARQRVSLEEMDSAIAEGATAGHKQVRKR
ncbi:MAG TPA: type II toxin-antitoxin system PrlF family antitoxin [Acidobacteriaceae bacterium]|jgi:AbrB family looped-hinge helix DNA binding protein